MPVLQAFFQTGRIQDVQVVPFGLFSLGFSLLGRFLLALDGSGFRVEYLAHSVSVDDHQNLGLVDGIGRTVQIVRTFVLDIFDVHFRDFRLDVGSVRLGDQVLCKGGYDRAQRHEEYQESFHGILLVLKVFYFVNFSSRFASSMKANSSRQVADICRTPWMSA